MSCDKESTTLFLTTINATSNPLLTSHSWTISMRTLLGTMYDKYDKFNLCLNTVSANFGNGALGSSGAYFSLTSEFDRNVFIRVSGLPLCNSFDATSNKQNGRSVLGQFLFNRGAISIQQYNNNFTTFYKNGSDYVTINIDYIRMDGSEPQTVFVFPHSALLFEIIGINDALTNRELLPLPPQKSFLYKG